MWTGIWFAVSLVFIVSMVLLIKSMNKTTIRSEDRRVPKKSLLEQTQQRH